MSMNLAHVLVAACCMAEVACDHSTMPRVELDRADSVSSLFLTQRPLLMAQSCSCD